MSAWERWVLEMEDAHPHEALRQYRGRVDELRRALEKQIEARKAAEARAREAEVAWAREVVKNG